MDAEARAVGLPARLARAISALAGWRRTVAAFALGSVSMLAYAPFHLFPVLLFSLPAFVWLIDSSPSPGRACRDGWWFGFGYFFFNLFWLGEAFLVEADKFAWALPFAVTLLPAGMALFWAAAAGVSKCFWRAGSSRVLVFALAFGLAEWTRGHVFTGLPWNVLGYALTYPIELMQSAALVGVYALTFLALLVFTAPLVILAATRSGGRSALAFALAPLTLLYAYGAWRLSGPAQPDVSGIKLRLVQPSVPQREKWLAEKQRDIFLDHLALSATAPDGTRDDLKGITHVVWPEAAMPFLPLEHQGALDAIGAMLPQGGILVTGAIRRERGPQTVSAGYNSLMAFDDTGKLLATYDKVHLVPFGEYLPMRGALEALGLSKLTHGLGVFHSGPLPRPVLAIPGLPPAGGLICYEVLFPGEVIEDGNRPQVLFNLTNDGWFGDTTGPRQHYYQTRVRAVEEGLPIVRVANNGISAVIDAYGRERVRIGLNAHASADSGLPAALAPTPYGRGRGSWVLAAVATLLAALGLSSRRRHGTH